MSFTVQQLLAVQSPPPPLYPSFDPLRPTHSSSSANENYDYIDPADLEPIASSNITSFRKYIESMSPPFLFESNLTVPFRGTRLMSEGDVTAYLETQVIPAALETILLLVPPPTDRLYDLITMRQRKFGGCVPDQVFGMLARSPTGKKTHFTPYAILEIKSPRIVQGMLSVFDALRAGKKVEPPADWIRATRQLTKYAFNIGVKDFVLMDDGCAIYFRFTSDSTEPGSVTYLVSHPDSTPRLSLREIIVFLNYLSLTANDILLRDYSHPATTGVGTDYQELSEQDPAPEQEGNRRVQPKRQQSEAKPSSTSGQFHGFQLHANLTLELLLPAVPSSATHHHRTGSRDSGFHESSTHHRVSQPPLTTLAPRRDFLVEHLITPNVAILSCTTAPHLPSVIAKIPHSPIRCDVEIAAYTSLLSLQGGPIPHFYGAARISTQQHDTTTTTTTTILLMELISPGTSIQSLGDTEQWDRIDALRAPAMAALDTVHAAGVVHQDAYARNFLVSQHDGEGVVLVDFDLASRHLGNWRRLEREKVADRVFLKEAFWVPPGTGEGV